MSQKPEIKKIGWAPADEPASSQTDHCFNPGLVESFPGPPPLANPGGTWAKPLPWSEASLGPRRVARCMGCGATKGPPGQRALALPRGLAGGEPSQDQGHPALPGSRYTRWVGWIGGPQIQMVCTVRDPEDPRLTFDPATWNASVTPRI